MALGVTKNGKPASMIEAILVYIVIFTILMVVGYIFYSQFKNTNEIEIVVKKRRRRRRRRRRR